MAEPVVLRIMTGERGEPSGSDTAIVAVPARWYLPLGADRAFIAQLAGDELRRLSWQMAARLGERLHSATWTVTADPGQVTALALAHDCATCRAGTDQALAFLRENPDSEVAVGLLRWA